MTKYQIDIHIPQICDFRNCMKPFKKQNSKGDLFQ